MIKNNQLGYHDSSITNLPADCACGRYFAGFVLARKIKILCFN